MRRKEALPVTEALPAGFQSLFPASRRSALPGYPPSTRQNPPSIISSRLPLPMLGVSSRRFISSRHFGAGGLRVCTSAHIDWGKRARLVHFDRALAHHFERRRE